MAFSAHDPRVFYDAIVARLVASTGESIGYGQAPTIVANEPYAVVHPRDEDDIDASLGDPTDVTIFNWQVTSVGQTPGQTFGMQQKARAALLGWQPVVAGIACSLVLRDGGQGLTPDDATQPRSFFTADLFTVLAD